ncbi:MAG: hypothetical protein IKO94_06020, partial [Selenomonadaceae bacterium]|nr:hypothetical protein [Selenomonadaceae bacterium]
MTSDNYYPKEKSFIAMRVAIPEIAHAILNGTIDIEIDGIYTLQSEFTEGKKIFVALGGDKGKKSVDWKTGFYAIAH